jgi:hypothetical protein
MARAAQVTADDLEDGTHEETPEPTLRETIEAARDSVIDAQVEDREAPPEGEASGPVRDNSGRFTRRAATAEGAESTVSNKNAPSATAANGVDRSGESAPVGSQQQPLGAAAPPAGVDSTLAPQGWTPSAKAKWASLDPEIKAEVSRREQETHRALSRQDDERGWGKNFAEISQRHAAIIQRAGVHPLRIYEDFLGIMNTLANGDPGTKAALIRDVAIRNGLDLRMLAGMQVPAGQNPNPQPPNAAAPQQVQLPPEIRQWGQEWQQFKQQQQQQAQEKEQREQQETFNEIVAFRSKPEARFFDAVKDQMVALLQVGAVQTLEDAYAQAIWTRPDIREVLQKEEAQKRDAIAARRARTEAARLKGGSVRGGAVSQAAEGGSPDRSLREELQANFAEARARV